MRFLRVLGLGRIVARLFGQILLAEFVDDRTPRGGDRLRRHLHAVGSHIGNETSRFAADVEALIEPLRDLHGAHRRKAELRRRGLLQGRCRERRTGIALGRLRLDRQGLERRAEKHALDVVGLRLVGNVELLQALAFEAGQPGLELLVPRRAEDGGDLPVFLADEALDLELAVADEPQRHRLHPARGTCAGQFAPQHRRQREADQIVERPARQIGVDQRRVDLARIGHCVEHRLLGDGVEHHAADRLVLQHALALQHFEHMPGNGLALAVRVGGEDQPVGILHRIGDLGQPLRRRVRRRPRTWRNRRRASPSRPWPAGHGHGRRRPEPYSCGRDTC